MSTIASVKAKLHLMLRPYYILTNAFVMVSTVSVSLLSAALLLTVPPCPAICKSGGTCRPVPYGVGATACRYNCYMLFADVWVVRENKRWWWCWWRRWWPFGDVEWAIIRSIFVRSALKRMILKRFRYVQNMTVLQSYTHNTHTTQF